MKHIHGGDIYEYDRILDYSANINPLGMPQRVKAAAAAAIDRSEHYPDPHQRILRSRIAAENGLEPEDVICGNGAAEILFLLAQAIKPKKALITAPSFAEYEQALLAADCRPAYYVLKEENNFALQEDYLDALSEDTDLVILCNPNNPTGMKIHKELLVRILEKCRECGIRMILDECFTDFLEDADQVSMTEHLTDGCLFLLRAFTKMYAMAGLRLGYGLCRDRGLLEKMNRLRQPWSVSVPAQEAGAAAMEEKAFVAETKAFVAGERAYLAGQLEKSGVRVYPGTANFLFFFCRDTDLKEKMIRRGILIRDCSNYRGLKKGYYRICVRKREENEILISALTECLKEG